MDLYNIILIIFNLIILIILIPIGIEFIKQKDRFNLLTNSIDSYRDKQSESQLNSLKILQESIQKNILLLQQEVSRNMNSNSQNLIQQIDKMIAVADKRLQEIHQHVDNKLNKSFEKTNATFSDILQRLALIDEAQKKITELSTNVVSLKDILNNRSTRGAFGEIQLESLVKNLLPSNNYKFQYTLSNQKRVDCLLILPPPSGNIAVDAKFPLEGYKKMLEHKNNDILYKQYYKQFYQDVKKHIDDIANKYIIPNETADGAMMFLPAESIFAEIHNSYPELITLAQQKKVWIVSPTTMMAVLTTACAVLKDEATKKQVHLIQENLMLLAKDFARFNKRMDDLAKHIDMANRDAEQVKTSAKKITSHFNKIENVQLSNLE